MTSLQTLLNDRVCAALTAAGCPEASASLQLASRP